MAQLQFKNIAGMKSHIRWLTCFFIFGLFISGATAIALPQEVHWLVDIFGAENGSSSFAQWLLRIRKALDETASNQSFLFYGTDWLAFAHFVIGIVFIGALRDPVRNRWLYDFGLVACVLVIPFAMGFGGWRGIPLWWRLIDCSFGVIGFIPLWFCRKWSIELEKTETRAKPE
jgi:hypothetical protein